MTATSTGLSPNTPAHYVFNSDPVDLGTVVANSQGVATLTFTVPASADAGAHTVTAAVTRAGGGATTLSQPFTVTGAASAPSGSSVGGVSAGETPSGTSTNAAGLARTGSGITIPLVRTGLVAIALGGLIVLGVRKRRGSTID